MNGSGEEFDPPSCLSEAEARRKQLTLDVQSIQAQLGDKQRTDENGRRLSSKEYWSWKKRATHALNQKLDSLRSIKQWIHEKRASMSSPRVEVNSKATTQEAVGHLQQLHDIIVELEGEGVDLDADEKAQVSAAGYFLRCVAENQSNQEQTK
jgi:DNA-binding transcriptional MerR regulator